MRVIDTPKAKQGRRVRSSNLLDARSALVCAQNLTLTILCQVHTHVRRHGEATVGTFAGLNGKGGPLPVR